MSRDLGDFQTPLPLVKEIIALLTRTGKKWIRALEPTCGQGNFIKGILDSEIPLREIQGIEIQDKYVKKAHSIAGPGDAMRIVIRQSNIFDVDFGVDLQWQEKGSLLVVGNPPWVTNSELSALQSKNVPTKTNFKGLRGLDAMTGGSNFDIAECILLKLIHELVAEQPTIAFLCKTIVARNIIKFAFDTSLSMSSISIRKFNCQEYFGAAVDACLFCFDIDREHQEYHAQVYQDLSSSEPSSMLGIVNGQLVSDVNANKHLTFIEGTCPLIWRQGLKHDAASIIELVSDNDGVLRNKLGEVVNVEQEYVYPLLKSSDLGGKEKQRPKRAVIVTQTRIGEDTSHLEKDSPQLWEYLVAHKHIFAQRQSSIYVGQALFSMFGVGDYSFAPYKVAISGMYKMLKFSAIGPVNGRPVIFDDTCYFIACESAKQAALVASLLNDPLCYEFVQSIIFWDAKRPVTKKLLQRINLTMLLERVDKQSLLERASIYFEQLEIVDNEELPVWPENLEELLKTDLFENGVHSRKRHLIESNIAQLSLFDI